MTVPDDLRLTVVVEPVGASSFVVRVSGDLDPHTAPQLDDELRALIGRESPAELVLDLGGVGFIDSAGLRVLLGVLKLQGQGGSTLVLEHLSAAAQRLLELTGLTDEFDVR